MACRRQPQTPQKRSRNAELLDCEPMLCQIPLSERPRDPCPKDTSFVDKLELVKESPANTGDKTQQPQDVTLVMEDTDNIIKFGTKNSRQQQQIQNELKALLEHEQKIIEQILDRAMKFKEFKDASKKSADEFEDEHNKRIPFYSQYLKQLAEIPETQDVTQEGMPRAVQAKILYNIVECTTHVANNTIVQLSMEKTLMNDVDLSMQKLRNFANFMITNFQTWNKTIVTQEKNLNEISTSYNKLNEDANKLKQTKPVVNDDGTVDVSPAQMAEIMISIQQRLDSLEIKIREILPTPKPSESTIEDEKNPPNKEDERRYVDPCAPPCRPQPVDPCASPCRPQPMDPCAPPRRTQPLDPCAPPRRTQPLDPCAPPRCTQPVYPCAPPYRTQPVDPCAPPRCARPVGHCAPPQNTPPVDPPSRRPPPVDPPSRRPPPVDPPSCRSPPVDPCAQPCRFPPSYGSPCYAKPVDPCAPPRHAQSVDPCALPQCAFTPSPECTPIRGSASRMDNCEIPRTNLPRGRDSFSPSSQEDRLYAGRDQCSPRSLSPPAVSCPQEYFSPDSLELSQVSQRGQKLFLPDSVEAYRYSRSGSPQLVSYQHDNLSPDSLEVPRGPSKSQRSCSPDLFEACPPSWSRSPQDLLRTQFPSPQCPAEDMPPFTPIMQLTAAEDGRIERSRALQEYQLDLLDVPGMGYPIPRAAMDKGGRPKGECIPLSPEEHPPPSFGRFVPISASSPEGSLRDPVDYPPANPPQGKVETSPELLNKVQEDLQRLSQRNKKLEDLVTNFREMRNLLTEEMDKAVRLNQKLQRDLYHLAQGADDHPQCNGTVKHENQVEQ